MVISDFLKNQIIFMYEKGFGSRKIKQNLKFCNGQRNHYNRCFVISALWNMMSFTGIQKQNWLMTHHVCATEVGSKKIIIHLSAHSDVIRKAL